MTKLLADGELPAIAVAFRHGEDIVVLFNPDVPTTQQRCAIDLAISTLNGEDTHGAPG